MNHSSFPVAVDTYEYVENGTEIYFPQIKYFTDVHVKQRINEQIRKMAFRLVKVQEEEQGIDTFDQMIGLYEIKTNERNVLSLTLTNYAIHQYFAHGLTVMASLNFDLETGEDWTLEDQFIDGSDFETALADNVNEQIEARGLPVFEQPVHVHAEQDYYIADKALVLFYQVYAIAPFYVGLPMFPISVYRVEDIVREDSLLARMLA